MPEGIRVSGRWYPALKMEWIDGESLHTYVERNLRQPQKLLDLAEQWVQIEYVHQNTQVVRSLTDHQVWRYDEASEGWRLNSDPPRFP